MKKIIVRCNTGIQIGIGHLVRCSNLMSVFNEYQIHFLIQSDIKKQTNTIIKRYNANWTVDYIDNNLTKEADLAILTKKIKEQNAILILDHYKVDESYQINLHNEGVRWLQFDSHAKQKLYAPIILHASPGASNSLYAPLINTTHTKALLGIKYIILNEQYRKISTMVKVRSSLKKVMICFGGSNDNKLILKCLNSIDADLLSLLSWYVVIGEHTQEKEKIKNITNKLPSIKLIENKYDLSYYQLDSDLIITSPGTLSYEAAALALPMLLVSTNDNQSINFKGWQDMGIAFNIGENHKIEKKRLNKYLRQLLKENKTLEKMSNISFNTIDNQGVFRVKKEILSIL